MIVVNADCIEFMRGLPDNSVDAIVTDPPYGMSSTPDAAEVLKHWLAGDDYVHRGGGFMGKDWDSFVPGPSVWREAFRILKPGGHLVAFASSRTYDLMSMAIRLGGFEVRDQLQWIYGSGFPKSMAVDKAIDRQRFDRDQILAVTGWFREARDAVGLDNKTIDLYMGTNGMAGHWTSQASQPRVPTLEQVPALLALLGLEMASVPEEIGRLIVELNGLKGQPAEAWFMRQVVGKLKTRDTSKSRPGMPNEPSIDHVVDVTAPATPEAKKWEGWGTALKPAHEPIVLARKKPEGTIADNVRKWGVGGINIDGCRVSSTEDIKNHARSAEAAKSKGTFGDSSAQVTHKTAGQKLGRFPSNVVHDGSDEATEGMGAAARYFYHPKATRADRDQYLDHLQPLSGGDATDRADGSAGTNNPRAGAGRTGGMRNPHPTVKPSELMRWLCRMITPPGGLVLDPFTGSGSTGVAAVREGFNFIGCDFTAEY